MDRHPEPVVRGHPDHPAVVVHPDRPAGGRQHGRVQGRPQRVRAHVERVAVRLQPGLPGPRPAGQRLEITRGGPAAGQVPGVGDQHPLLAGLPCGVGRLRRRRVLGHHGPVVQAEPGGGQERQPADTAVEAEEVLHVPVGRRAQQPLGRVQLGDLPAGPEDGDLVAHLDGLLDVVGDQHHGLVQLRLEPEELILQGGPDNRVDGAERLVHQQHRRVGGQRPGHPHPLLLAAGQLVRVAAGQVLVQADQRHQLPGPGPGLALAPADQQRHRADVVLDGPVREQPRLLDHVADAPAQRRRVLLLDVPAVQQDPPAGRIDQPVDHAQRGGLAAAARADQDHGLAAGYLKVETVHGDSAPGVPFRHALEGDQDVAFRCAPPKDRGLSLVSTRDAGTHSRPRKQDQRIRPPTRLPRPAAKPANTRRTADKGQSNRDQPENRSAGAAGRAAPGPGIMSREQGLEPWSRGRRSGHGRRAGAPR